MASEPVSVVCPNCGMVFTPEARARMCWSDRMQRYVRVMLTDAEWLAYDEKGSID